MGGSKCCITLMIFCLISPILVTPLSSAQHPNSQSHGFIISQDNGLTFDDVLYFNGSSTAPLSDYNWVISSIEKGAPAFESGKFTSVVAVADSLWEWEIEVNVSAHDCTCILHIFSSDLDHPPLVSRIVYLGQINHQPHILPFFSSMNGLLHEKPLFHLSQSNLSIDVPVVMPQNSNQESFVKLGICPAPNGFCLTEMIDFSNFNASSNQEQITVEIDRNSADLSDGFWLLNITVSDALLRTSNTEHFMILVDQNLPSVTLSCDVNGAQSDAGTSNSQAQIIVFESNPLSFSASVDDGYVGAQNILTWTLVLPDESRRALTADEQSSESLITLNPDMPGIWSVELLVRDTAGWLSHSSIDFSVLNVRPVIKVELDSFVVTNDATISLSVGENWTLNSSKTSDTYNDVDDLLHTWYVNGNTLVTGKMMLDSSDFTKPGEYDILLVVEDDNGATSELAFQVMINSIDDSSTISSETRLLLQSGILLFLAIFGFIAFSSRKKPRKTVVPKWVSGNDSSDDKPQ